MIRKMIKAVWNDLLNNDEMLFWVMFIVPVLLTVFVSGWFFFIFILYIIVIYLASVYEGVKEQEEKTKKKFTEKDV